MWDYARQKNLWISAAFIPGLENTESDEKSRIFDDKTEWSLNDSLFYQICEKFGVPSIDLFASRLNAKLDRYCSWEPDPGAIYIDSLMYDWSKECLGFAFPPFAIIHKVLQKMIKQEAELILIVPFWVSQPWFTLFVSTLCDYPLLIEVNNKELFLPFRTRKERRGHAPSQHPLTGQLKLLAARCSGKLYKHEAFLTRSYQPCYSAGEQALKNNMCLTTRSGKSIVSKGQLIHYQQVFVMD